MVQDNLGIVGFSDSRKNVEQLKKRYQEEYKRICQQEKETNKLYFKNKWKVKIGEFIATQVVFPHTPIGIVVVGSIVTGIGSKTTQLVMKIKNKLDKKKYKKQKAILTADFINADGIFKEFSVENNTSIENMNEYEIEHQEHKHM